MCAVQKNKKFDAEKFPHSATVDFSCFIILTSGMVDFVCFFGTAARQPHGGTVDLGCLKLRDGCNGCDDGCGNGVGCKFAHPIRHQTQQNEIEMKRFDKNEMKIYENGLLGGASLREPPPRTTECFVFCCSGRLTCNNNNNNNDDDDDKA